MFFTTLASVVALCLMMPFTRIYGVIGAVITAYFYPMQTLTLLGILALAGFTYLYIKHRRNSHA